MKHKIDCIINSVAIFTNDPYHSCSGCFIVKLSEMSTEIFNYAFITIWVLAENVFYYDHDFFNDVLSGDFLPDQLMKCHNTPF